MSDAPIAPMTAWLSAPMDADVSAAIERLRTAPDVRRIAVMPDVHLAHDVCIGVVVATSRLIYPQAVGGDIGCGMLAVACDGEAGAIDNGTNAASVLAALGKAIPARRRNRRATIGLPSDLDEPLSDPSLDSMRRRDGVLEFATLGSGNHFIELQADTDHRLWLMIHSGSRGLGPAIRDHHLRRAGDASGGLRALDAGRDHGKAYLHDVEWARRFAHASRLAMATIVGDVLERVLGVGICWETLITTDHNHVAQEDHDGASLWVHRKGAMPAGSGVMGVLPGSMGSTSFHVEGRGHRPALCSSAHGAGRRLTRTAARLTVSERDLRRQMDGVWYDVRLASRLRDEAPVAYKDIAAVLRAQHELVKVIRVLRPRLNYKGV
jgi:tRNA-splicing ligase RtcB